MRTRRLRLIAGVAGALACVGCADNDSVERARIVAISGYQVAADGRTMTVSAGVECQSKLKVFVTETDTEVQLIAIRNDPSCRNDGEDGSTMVQTTVVLEARLGRRAVADLGCQFLGSPEPCTLSS